MIDSLTAWDIAGQRTAKVIGKAEAAKARPPRPPIRTIPIATQVLNAVVLYGSLATKAFGSAKFLLPTFRRSTASFDSGGVMYQLGCDDSAHRGTSAHHTGAVEAPFVRGISTHGPGLAGGAISQCLRAIVELSDAARGSLCLLDMNI